jgi:hypothetical protein
MKITISFSPARGISLAGKKSAEVFSNSEPIPVPGRPSSSLTPNLVTA